MLLSVKVGVVVGLIVFLYAPFEALRLFMGGCYFEGICGDYHDWALPFALGAGCLTAALAGAAAGALVHFVFERERRSGQ
jgi:hypothetical protein